ncbi:MAG: M15 family metallopeptidase [Planctomycetota bacterium]
MSRLAAALLALGAAACASSGLQISTEPPVDDPLVEIAASDPRIRVDAVYATPENFVGETLYPLPRLFLRRSAMERLSRVQDRLEGRGLGLLVFDGYRPWSVTKRMWDVIGDPDFVADPSRGSRHNRGMAVDLALCDADGRPLPMPTEFDAFVPEARSDAEVLEPLRRNRDTLIEAMEAEGFRVLSSEWWHFDADGWEERGLLDVPIDRLVGEARDDE